MQVSLWLQGIHGATLIASLLAIVPWIIFIKLRQDQRDLLSLEASGHQKHHRQPPGSARGDESQSLLGLLTKNQRQRSLSSGAEENGWDLEIIIPAYNEELNIKTCIETISRSALFLFRQHGLRTRLIVVDDRSGDCTHAIAAACRQSLIDALACHGDGAGQGEFKTPVSITLLTSEERPRNEIWLGKSWASHTGYLESKGHHLFFIDADVSMKEPFLSEFLQTLHRHYEFAGFFPTLICKSLVDYIVQPNVALSTLILNKISTALDPDTKKPHAFGQCVYLSRRAYEITGGYEAVREDSMETKGLSANIVRSGILAKNIAGGDLIEVYMYHDARSLWEGWTKNFFVSVDKSIFNAIKSVILLLILFDVPLILLLFPNTALPILVFITGHLAIRVLVLRVYKIPLRGWFLFPVGGLAMSALMIGSAYKVLSGQNWTWKGRSLATNP